MTPGGARTTRVARSASPPARSTTGTREDPPTMRPILSRRRTLGIALILVLAGIGAAAGVMRAGARASSPLALIPANFAALNTASTALPGLPAQADGPSSAYGPAPGTVHSLGRGMAFAWVHAGAVCSSADIASGCADPSPSTEHGIDITISDPDLIRGGRPAQVAGLAVDSVVHVTATLNDGSTLSAV